MEKQITLVSIISKCDTHDDHSCVISSKTGDEHWFAEIIEHALKRRALDCSVMTFTVTIHSDDEEKVPF